MARTLIASTDCINFATSHEDMQTIQYSNENDYAGISYSVTPKPVFQVLVTAKFFKTREPSETEGASLSDDSVVILSDTLKSQKLIQVEPAPAHLHEVIHRALKHNYVLIGSELFSKEESYERKELDERCALETAECWLTKKEDSFIVNVFGTVTV